MSQERMTVSIEEFGARWEMRQPWWEWSPAGFASAILQDAAGNGLSCARLFRRELRFATSPSELATPPIATFKALGIGGVFTPENLRGRGYALSLTRWILEYAEAAIGDRFACAILFARRELGGLYEAAGFGQLGLVPGEDQPLWCRWMTLRPTFTCSPFHGAHGIFNKDKTQDFYFWIFPVEHF